VSELTDVDLKDFPTVEEALAVISPIVKAKKRKRHQRPETKAYQEAYRKAYKKAYHKVYYQRPAVKAHKKAYNQRPAMKAAREASLRAWNILPISEKRRLITKKYGGNEG